MSSLADTLVSVVALIHVAICVAEMFLWRWPAVHGRLGFDQAQADTTAPIVANAGLFNGFLAVGLFWGLIAAADPLGVKSFFLGCIIVAGLFGAVTLKWTTVALQSLPAGAALAVVWAGR